MRPVLRLLPLPLCIALSLNAMADERPEDWRLCPLEDAVPEFPDAPPPVGEPGDRENQPTEIGGDALTGVYGAESNLQGNATLRRGDQFLATDNLTYDAETTTYVADGSVRYQDSGMRIVAERLTGDQAADSHSIENVRYQLIERRGNGGAERAEMVGDQGSLIGSTYSTCPPGQRWWELRAGRIDVDLEEGFGTARNATLRVGKVPVLYMPWFKFPIDDRRKTGLLYPAIGYSSRNGFDYRQPIYLNLAPHYDMTLEPRIMTRRGYLLGTEFRYLAEGGSGTIDFEYLPSDRLTEDGRQEEIDQGIREENRREDDRGMFRYRGRQRINGTWQARASLNWISDPRYIEDQSSSLITGASSTINSSAGIYGRGRYWDGGLMADYRLLADYTLAETRLPFYRLPRAFLNWEQPFGPGVVAGLYADATRFGHAADPATAGGPDPRPGGSRVDLKPFVSFPIEGDAWYVRPTLAWRYTAYRLEDQLAENLAPGGEEPDTSPSRSLPIASVDAGLFFDRETLFRGDSYLHTLEPRLFYLNTPYRDQDNLPLFDTRAMTFSWGQLFRDNRFSGGDRQADANQLTVALTTRLIRESDGLEKLSASIGQIRYFDDSRVTLNPGADPLEAGESSWVAQANYAINDRWTMGAAYQWDPKINRDDLVSLRTRYLIGDDGIANFNYRYRRAQLEQVDFSFLYPLNPAWSLVGRYYYSLRDSKVLEGIAGVQWDSCCLAVRLVGRHYVRNRIGETNNAIQLEVELKGLGSAGPDTEGRLRRAILGYYRDDLYLVPPSELEGGTDDDLTIDPLP
ncbi:LPS-assembly protein LptD [Luteimonas sp. RD2P54]|uniref:LPS-assembly protein LptD n=1 Tax=Luteimonas endophytica TaxID=3042023 RepID=A0ABT6J5S6_9GAMM|nr:LPS-assembly protein LptD [Luteimonas endophytica]MDH5822175.1 LPS-assembly protein LptD [Luteimonas endophytica]